MIKTIVSANASDFLNSFELMKTSDPTYYLTDIYMATGYIYGIMTEGTEESPELANRPISGGTPESIYTAFANLEDSTLKLDKMLMVSDSYVGLVLIRPEITGSTPQGPSQLKMKVWRSGDGFPQKEIILNNAMPDGEITLGAGGGAFLVNFQSPLITPKTVIQWSPITGGSEAGPKTQLFLSLRDDGLTFIMYDEAGDPVDSIDGIFISIEFYPYTPPEV